LDYNLNGTPTNGIRVATTIPFTSGTGMYTVICEGYAYGSNVPELWSVSFYTYDSGSGVTFQNAGASSWGGVVPTLKLGNVGGFVNIFLEDLVYFRRFTLRAVHGAQSETNAMFEGWATSDANATTAGATSIVTPSFRNDFGIVNIGSASSAELNMRRTSDNYIWASGSGGSIALGTNNRAKSTANSNLVLKSDQNSYFNGSLGIGSQATSPAYNLDIFVTGVNGNARIKSATGTADLLLDSATGSVGRVFYRVNGTTYAIIESSSTGTIIFKTTSSETSRWSIVGSTGALESTGAQTIKTTTGALTFETGAANGDIIVSPHGTGVMRPAVDNTVALGTSVLRFKDIFAVQTTTGAIFETGLRTEDLGENETGTVVV
jgi:hypothetical protein